MDVEAKLFTILICKIIMNRDIKVISEQNQKLFLELLHLREF